jgi:hypothetical protein
MAKPLNLKPTPPILSKTIPVRIFHYVIPRNFDVKFARNLVAAGTGEGALQLGPEVVHFSFKLARVGDSGSRDARVL